MSEMDKQKLLAQFKEYAVLHPQLARVDAHLLRAIREPAGFAHVLVYGPSGVGKTTMIRQVAKRLNENDIGYTPSNGLGINRHIPQLPLLVIETRPPDAQVFNRTDYYRTALKLLDEPFYERRMLVDIEATETWEKKGRGRSSRTSQFNESPELRHALEEAMVKRNVRAVVLDEAQHLMKLGTGSSAGKLLDQLDWIKSMTNVTGVLHILIGTYEILNFRNLSGQASRRGLDIHFPRYLYQNEKDRLDFQAALLALLKQVPLNTDIPELMQRWLYFYEHSIGCVGVLKDWLIRAVAAALDDGNDSLSFKQLQEHSLTLPQCERMALDATEGEQKLSYMESRREHLWHLLQIGMDSPDIPASADPLETLPTSSPPNQPPSSPPPATKRTRKKSNTPTPTTSTDATQIEIPIESPPKKKQTRKKAASTTSNEIDQQALAQNSPNPIETPDAPAITIGASPELGTQDENMLEQATPNNKKKSGTRVGQRKPKRDTVGKSTSS
ncbi:ATP-binding protein [Aetokthonos hydrillicola Thurmond2011]|jgi:DNA polymerase III delta prime subunit|uniref:ATP-binding protein n=1 Tax=Aetokthonos hydrillicola Thurmond2011 TaxID=2712845 RepID=A0AAP5IEN5_9CYAN|nr:ATP-binding protein [Aetokthonos hydrillicola]MBO3463586.1 AAA family ATPase [Aetokthonos hydrillicola CCALA 1050]MDR9898989.1 ATP-binding protein [Aetokthonos hydrillicola Thurmond2011]